MRRVVIACCILLLAGAEPEGLALNGPAGSKMLAMSDLAGMPTAHLDVTFETEHGISRAGFDGPLLWTVLARSGAIDPERARDLVHEAVLMTGSDGYSAVLAMGEIAPEFENKPVILAERMNAQALAPGHLRIVPGDKRAGAASAT